MKALIVAIALALTACSPQKFAPKVSAEPAVPEADIEYLLTEAEGMSRAQAIANLTARNQATAAALAAGIADDPIARAEIARILANRHRELVLQPRIDAELNAITEEELQETYQADRDRFVQLERRQVAVLWLDPGNDPARRSAYLEKMGQATTWLQDNPIHTEDGFGTLSIDHSQHAASRFKNGIVGWFGQGGGSTKWARTVTDTAFDLDKPGSVSQIIANKEGIFLVRLVAIQPAKSIPFESVRHQLANQTKTQIRQRLTREFESERATRF